MPSIIISMDLRSIRCRYSVCFEWSKCDYGVTACVQAPVRNTDSKIAYEDFIAGLELINQQEYLVKAHTAGNEHWEEANWERLVKQRKNCTHGSHTFKTSLYRIISSFLHSTVLPEPSLVVRFVLLRILQKISTRLALCAPHPPLVS